MPISPKSILSKLADVFQSREGLAPDEQFQDRSPSTLETPHIRNEAEVKPKLNVSLDDLKVISTALLYYRRNLAKLGEENKASSVAQIDKKFYDIISHMEAQLEEREEALAQAA